MEEHTGAQYIEMKGEPAGLISRTEEEIYNKLGLPFIEPELREGRGEVEAALEGKLPILITRGRRPRRSSRSSGSMKGRPSLL